MMVNVICPRCDRCFDSVPEVEGGPHDGQCPLCSLNVCYYVDSNGIRFVDRYEVKAEKCDANFCGETTWRVIDTQSDAICICVFEEDAQLICDNLNGR